MDDPTDSLTDLLLNSILPNLRAVQVSQAEQIAANVPLDQIVRQLLAARGGTFSSPPTNFYLRTHLNSEFNKLSAQLIAARAEMAALHAALQTLQARTHSPSSEDSKLIH